MFNKRSPAWRATVSATGKVPEQHLVLGAAAVVIAGVLALRGWALFTSWFTFDDYVMLDQASTRLTWAHLLEPWNSHFMPGARFMTWLVADSGTLNWGLAALLLLGWQLLVSLAALWMLVTLFGARWSSVLLLALYSTSAMTIPATVWWAAAITQLPFQFVFFVAVGSWVRYLRSRRVLPLLTTVAVVALGLLFFEKVLLVYGVLAFMAVAYFAEGSIPARVKSVATRYALGFAAGGVLAVGFSAYYLVTVPQPFAETDSSLAANTAETMIGTAFASAAAGGPWQWRTAAASTALADPPPWTQHLSWVAITLVAFYALLTRHRTLRSWVLLTGYLTALWILLVRSRAAFVGSAIGLEYRYLTDAACVLMLSLGLAFLTLRGAPDSSKEREEPLLLWRAPMPAVWATTALVCAMSVVSSLGYLEIWRSTNGSKEYVHNLAADLKGKGAVDLIDQTVPDDVLSPFNAPDNTVSMLASLVSDSARFPETTGELALVTDEGHVRAALIDPAARGRPGPLEGCGWPVGRAGQSIGLRREAPKWDWWIRIGYLSSGESPVVVKSAYRTIEARVEPGINSLFLHFPASAPRSVRIEGLDPGTRLCVDTVEVGFPVAGGELP